LAALRHAKSLGHRFTLAICNVASSAMVRETSWHFITKAGTEIGVASTKVSNRRATKKRAGNFPALLVEISYA
jgi:glucosamine 6-phosphate synthetase-like amidotransferase/phosphosugar isomerase protein